MKNEQIEEILALNYSKNPGYLDCFYNGFYVLRRNLRRDEVNDPFPFPFGFMTASIRFFAITLNDIMPIIYFALFFTIIRFLLYKFIKNVLNPRLCFDNKIDEEKFPESVWKTILHFSIWFITFYLLNLTEYDYLEKPYDIWNGKENSSIKQI